MHQAAFWGEESVSSDSGPCSDSASASETPSEGEEDASEEEGEEQESESGDEPFNSDEGSECSEVNPVDEEVFAACASQFQSGKDLSADQTASKFGPTYFQFRRFMRRTGNRGSVRGFKKY